MTRKHTTESFIALAKAKHGSKYDYSKTKYITSHDRIEIICPEHGSFFSQAYHHLNYGCKKCGDAAGAPKRRTNIENFIERARIKHGNKYDYSKVSFTSQHQLVKIFCDKHGEFQQAANDHLKGRGCVFCGAKRRDLQNRWLDSLNIKTREYNIIFNNGNVYQQMDLMPQQIQYMNFMEIIGTEIQKYITRMKQIKQQKLLLVIYMKKH